jgi:ribonuclease BN (tRNA processing enzyme)
VGSVLELARRRLDLRFVEVDGSWQDAGPLRFRAVEVVHVPYLRCYGYLFDRGATAVGYSGDTTPCAGLHELARESATLVLECNGRHTPPGTPGSHMDEDSVRALQAAHPGTRLVLSHLGEQVDLASLSGVTVPEDFSRLSV